VEALVGVAVDVVEVELNRAEVVVEGVASTSTSAAMIEWMQGLSDES